MSPHQARATIEGLAEPGLPIELSLAEAIGLVLAESVEADVDLPPFDRADRDGYAIKADESKPGALLRVVGLRRVRRSLDEAIEAGESARVARGDALPAGADAVLRLDDVRPDPDCGPVRVIEVLGGIEAGQGVSRRGSILEAGSEILPAGTRLSPAMVPLLASQGSVHPYCHRRVRVAIVAVGDHLVPPAEAPVMNRERNATNAALVALSIRAGAMPHDLQAVAVADLGRALERATHSPVVIVVGPRSRMTSRALKAIGFEPVIGGLSLRPGGGSRYGVIRDDSGRVANHVLQLPAAPIAAMTAFTLLALPLISRLQGGPVDVLGQIAIWEGSRREGSDHARALPATIRLDADGRRLARPIKLRGSGDLPTFAQAHGLAILPEHSGPRNSGDVVEFLAFDGKD